MATRAESPARLPNAATPDAAYATVAGLYVALLLAPVAVLGLARVTSDGGVLYLGFLAAVTAVAAGAGWRVSRTPGLAVGLGGHAAVWLLSVLPFAWFVAVFGVVAVGGELPAVAAPLAMIGTIGGLFLGLVLTSMSRTRYATTALDPATEFTRWEARWPQRWRRLSVAAMIVAVILGVVGVATRLAFGVNWTGYLYVLVFLWTPLAGAANPRTFRVTDAGLVVERPLQRRLHPWSAFAGYTLTDDALVVRRTAWWRPAYRCDRTDIDDVDAAVAALDRALANDG